MITNDPRWAVLVARDSSADGSFVYAVQTTGVYCRPSCAARLARPENVRFFDTNGGAEAAGFRACKRCVPNQASLAEQHAAAIADVCRLIETSEEQPSLQDLAEHARLSTFHFHRVFKGITGLTPKQYATAHRARRVQQALRQSKTVTDAVYAVGYNSNSRFYAAAERMLGMRPSNYRAGAPGADIRFAVGECSLGSILVAQSEHGICAILLGDDPNELARDLQDRFPNANLVGGCRDFERTIAAVVGFVEAPHLGLHLPLDIQGTAFQQRVWQALQAITPGTTASYTEIAKQIGAPKSVRAVAGACAANALAVAIPCHRVVRNDGGISGYRWGVERKRTLLEREAQQ